MEIKVTLSLLVPGASLLTPEFCEKNPKKSYEINKIPIEYTVGKGKKQRKIKDIITIQTRKNRLVSHNINICRESYDYMLSTPTNPKLEKPLKYNKDGDVIKRVWDTLSIDQRLKHHFDLIAYDLRAKSYSYQILDD